MISADEARVLQRTDNDGLGAVSIKITVEVDMKFAARNGHRETTTIIPFDSSEIIVIWLRDHGYLAYTDSRNAREHETVLFISWEK